MVREQSVCHPLEDGGSTCYKQREIADARSGQNEEG